jgi:hypothetical protein
MTGAQGIRAGRTSILASKDGRAAHQDLSVAFFPLGPCQSCKPGPFVFYYFKTVPVNTSWVLYVRSTSSTSENTELSLGIFSDRNLRILQYSDHSELGSQAQ